MGNGTGLRSRQLRRRAAPLREGVNLAQRPSQKTLPHLHPDHVLEEALRRLGDLPVLPVVNRANFSKLEAS